MKILFVSMHSVHAIRWIENLKDTSFELFWYDVINKGKLNAMKSLTQFSNLQKRKVSHMKGEYFLSKKAPGIYQFIRPLVEVTENEALESIIKEIKPDVIHSFEMQSCSYPILKTMNKFSGIKWIYSCWGNDLYYYQDLRNHKFKIKNVLQRIDYLHTDCMRDYYLAKSLGFKGNYLGVIPGGTGYKIKQLEHFKLPIEKRKIILIKGYQHLFGRGLNIVKALESSSEVTEKYDVVIFGAHKVVFDYVEENNLNYKIYSRHGLSHQELLELMGMAVLYIGNNISDGMPNTLLEAIVMGAFPIQSNPGNATAEIIEDGVNGFLIENPEDVTAIQDKILKALASPDLLKNAFEINSKLAEEKLDYEINREKVISIYNSIYNETRF
ncbi:MAG TPA: glycosyltransferase [Flavobacterium sp.]|jgi:glycosyltransferase involved in cell wall biosynthesis